MKRRLDRKAARKARVDPNQLGLFEAAPAPAARVPPAPSQPKRQRSAIARKTALNGHPAVLNARDAATYIGISVSTLKAWRRTAIVDCDPSASACRYDLGWTRGRFLQRRKDLAASAIAIDWRGWTYRGARLTEYLRTNAEPTAP